MLVDWERAGDRMDAAAGDEDRAISVITISELLHGVHRARGPARTRRPAFVEHLLAALAHDMSVVTGSIRDFGRVDGLRVIEVAPRG